MHRKRAEIERAFVVAVMVDHAGPVRAAPLGHQIGRIKPANRAFKDGFVRPFARDLGDLNPYGSCQRGETVAPHICAKELRPPHDQRGEADKQMIDAAVQGHA